MIITFLPTPRLFASVQWHLLSMFIIFLFFTPHLFLNGTILDEYVTFLSFSLQTLSNISFDSALKIFTWIWYNMKNELLQCEPNFVFVLSRLLWILTELIQSCHLNHSRLSSDTLVLENLDTKQSYIWYCSIHLVFRNSFPLLHWHN